MKYILFALIFTLAGCQTGDASRMLSDYSLIAGMVAYKATTEIIEEAADSGRDVLFQAEQKKARAARVLVLTATAREFVDQEEPVTLKAVYDEIHELIDWDEIAPSDQLLVEDLLDLVRDRLAREVQDYNILTPETEVALLHIIDRIHGAASFYLVDG